MSQDFRDLMEIRIDESVGAHRYIQWKPFQIGRYTISVQASETHYSSPRESLRDPRWFYEWELGLTVDGEWALSIQIDYDDDGYVQTVTWHPDLDPMIFKGAPKLEAWYSNTFDTVVGWVPTDEIQTLIDNAARIEDVPVALKDSTD